MDLRIARALQVATIAAFAASGLMLVRLVDRDEPFEVPEPEPGAVRVRDAIATSRAKPMTVNGFVFDGPGARELRICDGRRRGDPPQCLGPFISLTNVEPASFVLRAGDDPEEGSVRYSTDTVTVVGTVIGTMMSVQVVLR